MKTFAMTGGATGIGAAIKQSLLDAGHQVIVVDIKEADIIADLSTPDGRRDAIAAIRDAAGKGLDGLIPCAGVASNVPDGKLIASLNYYGTVQLVEGLKDLLAQRQGAAVLISSNSAPHPTRDELVTAMLEQDEDSARAIAAEMELQQVYSGSKQAVARWMRRNTVSYAKAGVRLNAVAPGYTQTPMTKGVEEDPNYGPAIREFMASIPVGRPGQPTDIANAVCFLLSPEASFICGSLLYIDGGHDAMGRPDQI